jgi:KaiC/GvpD/RAD55 family RecA-like ATPase
MISNQGDSGQRSLAIVGFGGLGKTQVVLEFVWQHLSSFEAILWAQSDSRSKLEQAFIDFGRRLGLIPAQQSSETTQNVEVVKAWLEATGKTYIDSYLPAVKLIDSLRYQVVDSVR